MKFGSTPATATSNEADDSSFIPIDSAIKRQASNHDGRTTPPPPDPSSCLPSNSPLATLPSLPSDTSPRSACIYPTTGTENRRSRTWRQPSRQRPKKTLLNTWRNASHASQLTGRLYDSKGALPTCRAQSDGYRHHGREACDYHPPCWLTITSAPPHTCATETSHERLHGKTIASSGSGKRTVSAPCCFNDAQLAWLVCLSSSGTASDDARPRVAAMGSHRKKHDRGQAPGPGKQRSFLHPWARVEAASGF